MSKEFVASNGLLFSDVEDGKLYLSFQMYVGIEEQWRPVYEFVSAGLEDGTEDVCLRIDFALTDVVDSLIESHAYQSGKLENDSRPIVSAVREQALELLKRLDALEFEDSEG
jgi:hypothetical protein